ncbi:PssE/Cps14G family polysaccharide biosynthesis glycosyltransferase [Thalassotalea atypica]|uniref:PssE/Cps14G family polysaccharide biosynthesis glycosyltransferase n=1 Tax=Thalassotalea atypica TaxID=2054316 RepID=UPI0025744FE7|nr:PssE/Cps14G family polysaccharide biosynthesis glycosyltransferase [Thalassotalea atypica]
MKIFVTVGNTHYNSLIQAIDENLSPKQYDITIQLANGDYTPKNHEFFRYTDQIDKYFEQSDLVIAHAGAGTVFQLLEEHRRMVVVPNSDRVDDHQLDLASYLEENNLACVCHDFDKIFSAIEQAKSTTFDTYVNQPFWGYGYIDEFFEVTPSNLVGGLPIDIFPTMEDAVNHIISARGDVLPGSAIAINPEKVIQSINEPDTKEAILSASIRYADGIGVVKTLKRKSRQRVSRIPGCELWEALMEKSAEFDLPVFLVGATKETNFAAVNQLEAQYGVNVCGYQDGYFDKSQEQAVIERIVSVQPKIVSVALGSPRQELFIQQCRELCPDTFFMGVGGTYDVYTNKVKRAPLLYRKLNLEWFYRLANQPSRALRQGNLLRYLFLELVRKL